MYLNPNTQLSSNLSFTKSNFINLFVGKSLLSEKPFILSEKLPQFRWIQFQKFLSRPPSLHPSDLPKVTLGAAASGLGMIASSGIHLSEILKSGLKEPAQENSDWSQATLDSLRGAFHLSQHSSEGQLLEKGLQHLQEQALLHRVMSALNPQEQNTRDNSVQNLSHKFGVRAVWQKSKNFISPQLWRHGQHERHGEDTAKASQKNQATLRGWFWIASASSLIGILQLVHQMIF